MTLGSRDDKRVSNMYLSSEMYPSTAPRSWKSPSEKLKENLKRGKSIPSRRRVLKRSGIKLPLYYNAYTGKTAKTKIDIQKWKSPLKLKGKWFESHRTVDETGQEFIIMGKKKDYI